MSALAATECNESHFKISYSKSAVFSLIAAFVKICLKGKGSVRVKAVLQF